MNEKYSRSSRPNGSDLESYCPGKVNYWIDTDVLGEPFIEFAYNDGFRGKIFITRIGVIIIDIYHEDYLYTTQFQIVYDAIETSVSITLSDLPDSLKDRYKIVESKNRLSVSRVIYLYYILPIITRPEVVETVTELRRKYQLSLMEN